MDSLVFTPSSFDFGVIPITKRPISLNFSVENVGDETCTMNFSQASDSYIWFTTHDEKLEKQRSAGFDIFFVYNKLQDFTLEPKSSYKFSCVLIPAQCIASIPTVLSIPYIKPSFQEPQFIEIGFCARMTTIEFKVTPRHLFLNNCVKGQIGYKSFTLKNMSEISLPIILYPSPSVQVQTPDLTNYIELGPKESVNLTISHTPTEIGQFNHKIAFDCLLSPCKDPTIMYLMTSVSPPDLPSDFPLINPESGEIDFGEIHAGIPAINSFTVTNPSSSTYDLAIDCVIDLFVPKSQPGDHSLSGSMFSSSTAPSRLIFKSPLIAKTGPKIDLPLQPNSFLTIETTYLPAFHLAANTAVFEHRTFMITLTFTDKLTNATYYRHLKCKAAVCHSSITISPESIDFGDTIIGKDTKDVKTATVTITNESPLATVVKARSSSRSLVISPLPIEIRAHSNYKFEFSFYPKRINPDYNSQIAFINENNTSNEKHLSIAAIVVAAASESMHSMCYSLVCDGSHFTSLNFQHCPINYPSLKSFTIKNRTNNALSIKLTTSAPQEISLYIDDIDMTCSNSLSSISNSSSILSELDREKDPYPLLNSESPPLTIKDLAYYMRYNSPFYINQFTLTAKYKDSDLVEHFETLHKQLTSVLNDGLITQIDETEITIPPLSRKEIFVFLQPRSDKKELLWKHREEKMFIDLIGENNIAPLSVPITFNIAQSVTLLTTHHLNFGTIQCNSHYQHKIYLLNESTIPLLFKLESNVVTFDKQTKGIVYPFSSYSIPFSLVPKIDGKLNESIIVHNILNADEHETISLKGSVMRRSNFFIDPIEIDFGDILAGSSSKRVNVFITNTATEENEFTFSHVQKDILTCRPLISYQFKNMNSRRLTDSMKLQIEKLGCKLRCLQRKKKVEYAAKIQLLIDKLSRTEGSNTATQLRQLEAKYMDRLTFNAAPLHMHCIEFQLIPSLMAGKRLSMDINLEGAVLVYERGRSETTKIIRYKAHLIPETKRLLDSVVQKSLQIDQTNIVVDHVYVHDCVTTPIKIKNISNTAQNFWVSSNSGNDAIVSSPKSEGSLKFNESTELIIDIFCLIPGTINKQVTITTQASSQTINFQITAEYKPILSFPYLPEPRIIDFGKIPLTSLQVIERRSAFNISNIFDQCLYVSFINSNPKDILIYEQDPKIPQVKPIFMNPHSTIRMNILIMPIIDPEHYYRYKTTLISGQITVKAFQTEEEATESQSVPCLYASSIEVKAAFGRIGLLVNETNIDFGSVTREEQTYKLTIKNRSSHIPLDVFCTCTQGLTVEPSSFVLPGHKENKNPQELALTFVPSTDGVNSAQLQLNVTGSTQYSKSVKVTSFVDPGLIATDLPLSPNNIDTLNVGSIYVLDNKPVAKPATINFSNKSNMQIYFKADKFTINLPSKRKYSLNFMYPYNQITFNPEDPTFVERLYCKSSSTQRILKIIDITGTLVVSTFTLSKDTVSFGRFGAINKWNYIEQFIIIQNTAKIDLDLNITCKDKFIKLPPKIDGIKPLEEKVLGLVPVIDELMKVEGQVSTVIHFQNRNNPQNIMKLNVKFDIRKAFLSFQRVFKINENTYEIEIQKFTQVVNEESKETTWAANNWFSITNCFDDECYVEIEVRDLIADTIKVEMYLRKSEIRISSLDMQPNESIEIRAKAIVNGQLDFLTANQETEKLQIAQIIFKSEDVEPILLNVISRPGLQ